MIHLSQRALKKVAREPYRMTPVGKAACDGKRLLRGQIFNVFDAEFWESLIPTATSVTCPHCLILLDQALQGRK